MAIEDLTGYVQQWRDVTHDIRASSRVMASDPNSPAARLTLARGIASAHNAGAFTHPDLGKLQADLDRCRQRAKVDSTVDAAREVVQAAVDFFVGPGRDTAEWWRVCGPLADVIDAWINATAWMVMTPESNVNGAVFHRQTKTLTLNGKPLRLSAGERDVLTRLVETGAAKLSELRLVHSHPDRVLKGLRDRYPSLKKYIFIPGGGYKGGYSTIIAVEE